jgi:hypothetical protein
MQIVYDALALKLSVEFMKAHCVLNFIINTYIAYRHFVYTKTYADIIKIKVTKKLANTY